MNAPCPSPNVQEAVGQAAGRPSCRAGGGRAEEGKAVTGAGRAELRAALCGTCLGSSHGPGGGRGLCIHHNVPWAKAAQATEQRQTVMKEAPLPTGSLQGWFLEGEINGNDHHRKLKGLGLMWLHGQGCLFSSLPVFLNLFI